MKTILNTFLFSDWILYSSRIIGTILLLPTWQFWRGLNRCRIEGRPFNVVTLYQASIITTLSAAAIIGTHPVIIVFLCWIWWNKLGDWYFNGTIIAKLLLIRIFLGLSCSYFLGESNWLYIILPIILEVVYRFAIGYNSIFTSADGNV